MERYFGKVEHIRRCMTPSYLEVGDVIAVLVHYSRNTVLACEAPLKMKCELNAECGAIYRGQVGRTARIHCNVCLHHVCWLLSDDGM